MQFFSSLLLSPLRSELCSLSTPIFFLSSLWGPSFTPVRNNRKYDSCCASWLSSLGEARLAQSVSGCLLDREYVNLFSPQTPCCFCPICFHEVDRTPLSLPFTFSCIRCRDKQFRRQESSSLSPSQKFPAYSGTRWIIITVFTRSRHLYPS